MAVKMELVTINILVGITSAALMFGAIIYILTYVLSAFSSKSGQISLKVVLSSISYFLGSTILLLMGSNWLSGLARVPIPGGGIPYYLNIGASALALNALLHIGCSFLTAFMYVKGKLSRPTPLAK